MSVETPHPQAAAPTASGNVRGRRRQGGARVSLIARGEPMVWLMGSALVMCLLMIVGLLSLILWRGIGTFWPTPLVQIETVDGRAVMGEITDRERYQPGPAAFARFPDEIAEKLRAKVKQQGGWAERRLVRSANYELTGEHFTWVSDFEIQSESEPKWAVLFERLEGGRFNGIPVEFLVQGDVVADTPSAVWQKYEEYHDPVSARRAQQQYLNKYVIGDINHHLEQTRLELKQAALDYGQDSPEYQQAQQEYQQVEAETIDKFAKIRSQVDLLADQNDKYHLTARTADGQTAQLALADIVRAVPANQLTLGEKFSVYFSRWWECLSEDPREANSEGGIFPAIFGTVVMTLIMSLAVVPFGVLAALYLREYAKAGPVVSAVRISVNNLAGVPSIVFGVFGLGFFCYGIGKFVDGGPENLQFAPWPPASWFIALGILAVTGTGAFLLGVSSFASRTAEATPLKRAMRNLSMLLWLVSFGLLVALIVFTPHFSGLYEASLPKPTFGKGGLLWASLTLALLTLPVVIVATEEALAAVPNSMREGSYACGASKWQTIKRIVMPRAMPGIMTGMILAMARGAGEVAPLMLVGAVKLAPALPMDATSPFIHGERSFMHLGFHIFDLALQSPNSEAAKPMVYTTTLLLILIIALLNLTAIWLRARLRRKFISIQF